MAGKSNDGDDLASKLQEVVIDDESQAPGMYTYSF